MTVVVLDSKLCRPPFIVHPNAGGAYWVSQICDAYGFPKLTPGAAPLPRIGVVSLGGGYRASDVSLAANLNGLPVPTVTSLSVGGAGNAPGDAADGENALDIQASAFGFSYVTGLAARVTIAFAPNTGKAFALAARALVDADVATITISWGAMERAWTKADVDDMVSALQYARSKKVPVSVASGDGGSADGGSGNNVDFPASSPLVIACGGTSLRGVNPRDEVVWNAGGGAAGGGVSALFPTPAYQAGFVPSGLAGRGVPDLSADADPAVGYKIVLNGQVQAIGGTSAVAPLVAGVLAAFKAGGADISSLPDRLYQMEPAFYDIVTGNNGAYSATRGYDLASGLGSLDGAALYAALKGAVVLPPPPAPSPGTVTGRQAKDAAAHGLQAYAARPEYAGKRNKPYRDLILGGIPWTDLYLDHLYQGVKP